MDGIKLTNDHAKSCSVTGLLNKTGRRDGGDGECFPEEWGGKSAQDRESIAHSHKERWNGDTDH